MLPLLRLRNDQLMNQPQPNKHAMMNDGIAYRSPSQRLVHNDTSDSEKTDQQAKQNTLHPIEPSQNRKSPHITVYHRKPAETDKNLPLPQC